MGTSTAKSEIVHKHLRLNERKLKRAQKVLCAKTDTETVERALDLVLTEHERNSMVERAHGDFFGSGIRIRDVYGALES